MKKYLVDAKHLRLDGPDAPQTSDDGTPKVRMYIATPVDARLAELTKELLERGGHKQDCPISWKGECYCGWLEMKQSLMGR